MWNQLPGIYGSCVTVCDTGTVFVVNTVTHTTSYNPDPLVSSTWTPIALLTGNTNCDIDCGSQNKIWVESTDQLSLIQYDLTTDTILQTVPGPSATVPMAFVTVDPATNLPIVTTASPDNHVYKLFDKKPTPLWQRVDCIDALDIAKGHDESFAWSSTDCKFIDNRDPTIYMYYEKCGRQEKKIIGYGENLDIYDKNHYIYSDSRHTAYISKPCNY